MRTRYRAAAWRVDVRTAERREQTFDVGRATGPRAGFRRGAAAAQRRVFVAIVGVLLLVSCAEPEPGERVVARGRHVELVTERDDPVCAGTVRFMDAIVDAGFAFLGETPPDRVFIRYEWQEAPDEPVSIIGEGSAHRAEDGVLVRTDQLIEEHELAHAVHLFAWPRSARFMEEGLAILLDAHRVYARSAWPSDLPLDDILADPLEDGANYQWAWFLVSQIVRDHGAEGLRALWRAVPADSSAADVRDAYASLFGRSIDALIEPLPEGAYDVGKRDGPTRNSCGFSLCPGEASILDGVDAILVPGPTGCEDDADAIGPHSNVPSIEGPPVWRQTVIEAEDVGVRPQQSSVLASVLRPCWLDCSEVEGGGGGFYLPIGDEGNEFALPSGRWRVETRRELEDLPTEDPGVVEIRRFVP